MVFQSEHPSFTSQPELAASVWRYMDLPRFLSILEDGQLFFARADAMSDKWEGAFSDVNLKVRPLLYGEEYPHMATALAQIPVHTRQSTFMSCWHLSEYESMAMWDLYQRENRGVAIRSTWSALTQSLVDDRDIYGAKVDYVDYSKTFIPEGSVFSSYLYKRLSYEHEREVRLMVSDSLTVPDPSGPHVVKTVGYHPFIQVKVDVRKLIECVYVAPGAPSWIFDLLRKVINRYDSTIALKQSDLSRDAVT